MRPALSITRFIPMLVPRVCKKCHFDFRFSRGWMVRTPERETYYMCGKCGTTRYVVNTWFCEYLEVCSRLQQMRDFVIRTDEGLEIWRNFFRSCVEGKKMFFQLAKIPGICHDHRTLILEAQVHEVVEELVKRVPNGPIRVHAEDGVLKSISFHEE